MFPEQYYIGLDANTLNKQGNQCPCVLTCKKLRKKLRSSFVAPHQCFSWFIYAHIVYKTGIIKERDQSVKATAKRDHQAQVHFVLGCRFH
jgi:hypothetical protein